MSFTLTYKDLSNPNFIPGLKKIAQSDKWDDPKKVYNLARMSSLLDQELKTFYDLRAKFFRKVKEMKPEKPEDVTEEITQALKAEADKFSEVSFVIERHKVDFKDLAGIPLSPNELLALEPLIDNLPE